ncbi:hypothetical protein Pmani_039592, partial [Petrolisthes manimaculis]
MPVLICQDDVESFLRSNPSFEEIDVLTKHELQLVARGLGVLEVSDILKAHLVEKVWNEMQVRSDRSVQGAQGWDMAAGAEDEVEEQREVEPVTMGLPSMREILSSSVTDQQVELARIQAQVEMARINAQLEQQRLECGERRESDVLHTENGARAAIIADEYVISRKMGNVSWDNVKNKTYDYNVPPPRRNVVYPQQGTTQHRSTGPQKQGEPIMVKQVRDKPKACYYCGKLGHLERDCFKKSKEVKDSQSRYLRDFKAVSFISSLEDNCIDVKKHYETECSESKQGTFDNFILDGKLILGGKTVPIKLLRDTGASQSLVLSKLVGDYENLGRNVLLRGLSGCVSAPLVEVTLTSNLVSGRVIVGSIEDLPVSGIDMILGNDLAGGRVHPVPIVSNEPERHKATEELVKRDPIVFPSCAVTRAMSQNALLAPEHISVDDEERVESGKITDGEEDVINLGETILGKNDFDVVNLTHCDVDSKRLLELQKADESLVEVFKKCEDGENQQNEIFVVENVLKRKWVPIDADKDDITWMSVEQVVVPKELRQEILSMAHDGGLSGHLGIRKTVARIRSCFYWPSLKRDVADYCRTCDTCQKMGKPNQSLKVAPLIPIPHFGEPFERVQVDIVGPLPRTSNGHLYILTIMDMATRYPEAVPLRNISASVVIRELINFFTHFGLPKEIQSDQGSNFLSKIFRQVMRQLNITQVSSTAYHPQSQGTIERFHQTLKSMLRKHCEDYQKEWDKSLPYVLFAIREVPNESLGFSPFELLFGHNVKGPLRLVKEKWLEESNERGLLKYVTDVKLRLKRAWELAECNLKKAQTGMKVWYDRKARVRIFKPGDEILLLLPVQGQPLAGRFQGPYRIVKKLSDVNYVVETPDKRKSRRICHVNMIKLYYRRENPVAVINVCSMDEEDEVPEMESRWNGVVNVEELIRGKTSHLESPEREELSGLLYRFQSVFRNSPGRTNVLEHDVDVGEADPRRQRPYRVNPKKADVIRKEIQYMLEHDLVESCQSEWASPVTLVDKP